MHYVHMARVMKFDLLKPALAVDSNKDLSRSIRWYLVRNVIKRFLVMLVLVVFASFVLSQISPPRFVNFIVGMAIALVTIFATRDRWPLWDPFAPCSALIFRVVLGEGASRSQGSFLSSKSEQKFLVRWISRHPNEIPATFLLWETLAEELKKKRNPLVVDIAVSFAPEHPGTVADILDIAEAAGR